MGQVGWEDRAAENQRTKNGVHVKGVGRGIFRPWSAREQASFQTLGLETAHGCQRCLFTLCNIMSHHELPNRWGAHLHGTMYHFSWCTHLRSCVSTICIGHGLVCAPCSISLCRLAFWWARGMNSPWWGKSVSRALGCDLPGHVGPKPPPPPNPDHHCF